jgi:hypothetical protein
MNKVYKHYYFKYFKIKVLYIFIIVRKDNNTTLSILKAYLILDVPVRVVFMRLIFVLY